MSTETSEPSPATPPFEPSAPPSWPAVLVPDGSRSSPRGVHAARAVVALAAMLGFAVVYGQDPLFASNQNTYLVHGLANAGLGFLSSDWFVRTPDPAPVFSAIVQGAGTLDDHLLYVAQAALLGVYWYAIVGIGWCVFNLGSRARLLAFMAVLFALDSRLLDGRYNVRSLTSEGVALQQTPGPEFQPSAFGVFLVLALYLFLRRRAWWAIGALAIAATFHPIYVLPAAVEGAAFAGWVLWRERQPRRALAMLGGLAAFLAPITVYTFVRFHTSAAALHVLAHVRQPYHALPAVWFDRYAAFSLLLVATSLIVVWRTRLFPALAALVGVGTGLTLIQVATGSDWLGNAFPWRVSVVLVPVATCLLVALAVSRTFDVLDQRPRTAAIAGAGAAATLAAITVIRAGDQVTAFRHAGAGPAKGLIAHVRKTKRPTDTYLVPIAVRTPRAAGRPLEPFRLRTGAPIYVDWKSVPYSEILWWYARVRAVQSLYAGGLRDCAALAGLVRAGVTHAVVAEGQSAPLCAGARRLYRDAHYSLYRLGAPTPTG